jgi:hypothetical protein
VCIWLPQRILARLGCKLDCSTDILPIKYNSDSIRWCSSRFGTSHSEGVATNRRSNGYQLLKIDSEASTATSGGDAKCPDALASCGGEGGGGGGLSRALLKERRWAGGKQVMAPPNERLLCLIASVLFLGPKVDLSAAMTSGALPPPSFASESEPQYHKQRGSLFLLLGPF